MSKKMHKKPSRPGTRRPSSAGAATTPRAAAAARPRKSAKPDGADSSKVLQRGNRPGTSPAKRGSSTSVSGAAATDLLAADSKAPDFRLPRDGGATVSLADFRGRHLVLFFYPRANTPGCTKEAMDFSRLAGAFAALGADVVGVSADPPKAQEAFRARSLRRLGQEDFIRQGVRRNFSDNGADRPGPPDHQRLAQRQGGRPRRGGAEIYRKSVIAFPEC